MGNAAAETPVAPGFRFHPSDEELISYYLKRKVKGKPMRVDAIGEDDIYKHEPWDLGVHSKLKTRDKEWFFFRALDKKYPTDTSVKRATKQGYWNITGRDREIRRGEGEVLIGMIKTLVFYTGRAPYGRRTDWVMHEYRLAEHDEGLQLDAYVLCRVFLKQDTGKPRYAPFLEEEWVDDGERAVSSVPFVVDANRINEIQQENQWQSKIIVDLNELPRESDDIDDDPYPHQKHHNNKEHDDERLKRESAAPLPHCVLDKEVPLPLCVLNKEAPLPLVQYKRKRQIDSTGNSNSSSQISQDHCSFSETIINTASAEPLEISTMQRKNLLVKETETEPVATRVLTNSFTKMIKDLLKEKEQEPVAKMVPASSPTKRIKDLLKEKQEMVVFIETHKRDMMEAEIVVNFLEDKIDALRKDNVELRTNNSNKGQNQTA